MMLEPEQPCWISGWGATHEKGEGLLGTQVPRTQHWAWKWEVWGVGVNPTRLDHSGQFAPSPCLGFPIC